MNELSKCFGNTIDAIRTQTKYRKSYERGCISGFMSTSDVFESSQDLRTFKTSRVTINPEMQKQVHTIFLFIIYLTKLLSP